MTDRNENCAAASKVSLLLILFLVIMVQSILLTSALIAGGANAIYVPAPTTRRFLTQRFAMVMVLDRRYKYFLPPTNQETAFVPSSREFNWTLHQPARDFVVSACRLTFPKTFTPAP
jgi:hypothetical protein